MLQTSETQMATNWFFVKCNRRYSNKDIKFQEDCPVLADEGRYKIQYRAHD